jgi:hypothetical protein
VFVGNASATQFWARVDKIEQLLEPAILALPEGDGAAQEDIPIIAELVEHAWALAAASRPLVVRARGPRPLGNLTWRGEAQNVWRANISALDSDLLELKPFGGGYVVVAPHGSGRGWGDGTVMPPPPA